MSAAPALRSRRGPIPARTLPLLPGEELHSECRLDDAPLAVLDCETTGLEPGAHRIVTLAVVHAELGSQRSVEALNLVVNPCRPVPTIASDIHGYTTSRLTRLVRTGQIGPYGRAVQLSVNRALRGRVPVAHNLAFDAGFLAWEQGRAYTTPWFEVAQGRARWWGICTRDLARLALPGRPHDLAGLCAHYGIPLERPLGTHFALEDAGACFALLGALVQELRAQGHVLDTVGDAIALPAVMLGADR